MKYYRKILSLLKKIKNPGYFLYQLFHYIKCYVPSVIARYISRKNRNGFADCNIVFKTYDGSDQACHPDLTFFNQKLWITMTPYPYGMDEYENPIVYSGEKFENLLCQVCKPLDKPKIKEYGYHLSDPCLAETAHSLMLLYRESRRNKKTHSDTNTLYLCHYDVDNLVWKKPVVLSSSDEMQYLSPAIINCGEKSYCYFAEFDKGQLLLSEVVDGKLNAAKEIKVLGMPFSYYVWHLTVAFKENKVKYNENDSVLAGLFLLRSKDNRNDFKLVLASSESIGKDWTVLEEINIPYAIRDSVKIVYKSAFMPFTDDILISYRDKLERYCFTITGRD